VGLAFLSSLEELNAWWKKVAQEKRDYIVEERLFGREFTVGVVDLGKGALPLPVSEVVITNPGGAFDYEGKYLGRGTKEITPASVTSEELVVLQKLGVTAHNSLGCFGYSRTDVIMGPKGAYFLETNTLPGLTRASFIPQQLSAAGVSMTEFLTAQILLAEQRQKQL
jgi:D-alanine-D-alanine ligase